MTDLHFKILHSANTPTIENVDAETQVTLNRADAWVKLVWDADEELLKKMKEIYKQVEDESGEPNAKK